MSNFSWIGFQAEHFNSGYRIISVAGSKIIIVSQGDMLVLNYTENFQIYMNTLSLMKTFDK
jgi:hypothetical protein